MGDAGLSEHSFPLPHNIPLTLSPRHISNVTVDYRMSAHRMLKRWEKARESGLGSAHLQLPLSGRLSQEFKPSMDYTIRLISK